MCLKNLHKYQTKYFADSVEWCSNAEYTNIFSCGTYQLDSNTAGPQRRIGSILVFDFKIDGEKTNLEKLYEKETDGILDQKWLNHTKCPLLATATSSGRADVYSWEKHQLQCISSIEIDPEDQCNIILSLDWDYQSNKMLLSDSKGYISLLDFNSNSSLTLLNRWIAHSYEAWTCCFHKNNPNIVLSGGDDSLCRIYDLRDTSKEKCSIKSHEAGVTSFLTFESRPNIICTGSYDEYLRVFDMRSPRNPLESINLGGGIWRLKANPVIEDVILCACMYHNFTICNLQFDNGSSTTLQTKAKFNMDHKSICYGADWSPIRGSKEEFFIGCCSFYDSLLTVNSFDFRIDNKDNK